MERFIITVARETGSGGHNVTRRLSEALGIPYYDRDLLRKASEVSGIHERLFGAADERIGLREMLSAAEKVYTGEILPPDSDDYISTRNLFSFQAKIIKELHAAGTTILLVEQNARAALSVADRAYVLETGTISMEGPAAELAADDRVRKAYLGA